MARKSVFINREGIVLLLAIGIIFSEIDPSWCGRFDTATTQPAQDQFEIENNQDENYQPEMYPFPQSTQPVNQKQGLRNGFGAIRQTNWNAPGRGRAGSLNRINSNQQALGGVASPLRSIWNQQGHHQGVRVGIPQRNTAYPQLVRGGGAFPLQATDYPQPEAWGKGAVPRRNNYLQPEAWDKGAVPRRNNYPRPTTSGGGANGKRNNYPRPAARRGGISVGRTSYPIPATKGGDLIIESPYGDASLTGSPYNRGLFGASNQASLGESSHETPLGESPYNAGSRENLYKPTVKSARNGVQYGQLQYGEMGYGNEYPGLYSQINTSPFGMLSDTENAVWRDTGRDRRSFGYRGPFDGVEDGDFSDNEDDALSFLQPYGNIYDSSGLNRQNYPGYDAPIRKPSYGPYGFMDPDFDDSLLRDYEMEKELPQEFNYNYMVNGNSMGDSYLKNANDPIAVPILQEETTSERGRGASKKKTGEAGKTATELEEDIVLGNVRPEKDELSKKKNPALLDNSQLVQKNAVGKSPSSILAQSPGSRAKDRIGRTKAGYPLSRTTHLSRSNPILRKDAHMMRLPPQVATRNFFTQVEDDDLGPITSGMNDNYGLVDELNRRRRSSHLDDYYDYDGAEERPFPILANLRVQMPSKYAYRGQPIYSYPLMYNNHVRSLGEPAQYLFDGRRGAPRRLVRRIIRRLPLRRKEKRLRKVANQRMMQQEKVHDAEENTDEEEDEQMETEDKPATTTIVTTVDSQERSASISNTTDATTLPPPSTTAASTPETTEEPSAEEKDVTETTEEPSAEEKDVTETTEEPSAEEKGVTETTEEPSAEEKDATETSEEPSAEEKDVTETTFQEWQG